MAAAFAALGCASRQSPRDLIRSADSVRLVREVDIQGFADSVSVRGQKGTFSVRTNPFRRLRTRARQSGEGRGPGSDIVRPAR